MQHNSMLPEVQVCESFRADKCEETRTQMEKRRERIGCVPKTDVVHVKKRFPSQAWKSVHCLGLWSGSTKDDDEHISLVPELSWREYKGNHKS